MNQLKKRAIAVDLGMGDYHLDHLRNLKAIQVAPDQDHIHHLDQGNKSLLDCIKSVKL